MGKLFETGKEHLIIVILGATQYLQMPNRPTLFPHTICYH